MNYDVYRYVCVCVFGGFLKLNVVRNEELVGVPKNLAPGAHQATVQRLTTTLILE